MIAPTADMIEIALTQLQRDASWKKDELILPRQQEQLLIALPHRSDTFAAGYELGIQAARVLVAEKFKQSF